jgi:hypothetical protein
LEAVVVSPSVISERAVALAAMGSRLVEDAQEQAERLFEATQTRERNSGDIVKAKKPDET